MNFYGTIALLFYNFQRQISREDADFAKSHQISVIFHSGPIQDIFLFLVFFFLSFQNVPDV